MKTYEIEIKQVLTEEDLDDLVDAALNACGYWCDLMEYGKEPKDCKFMSQALSHGGTLVFTVDEPFIEGGETKFELTTEKLLEGIKRSGGFDTENYDGGVADNILQRALFGEVIYG